MSSDQHKGREGTKVASCAFLGGLYRKRRRGVVWCGVVCFHFIWCCLLCLLFCLFYIYFAKLSSKVVLLSSAFHVFFSFSFPLPFYSHMVPLELTQRPRGNQGLKEDHDSDAERVHVRPLTHRRRASTSSTCRSRRQRRARRRLGSAVVVRRRTSSSSSRLLRTLRRRARRALGSGRGGGGRGGGGSVAWSLHHHDVVHDGGVLNEVDDEEQQCGEEEAEARPRAVVRQEKGEEHTLHHAPRDGHDLHERFPEAGVAFVVVVGVVRLCGGSVVPVSGSSSRCGGPCGVGRGGRPPAKAGRC
eukprot:Rhum_TRINITY_DN14773_c23_g1::Rhum_TRINITY_DN14773_c23_g1_i1::g.117375::m.117375